jgi:HlyD family secretion protein
MDARARQEVEALAPTAPAARQTETPAPAAPQRASQPAPPPKPKSSRKMLWIGVAVVAAIGGFIAWKVLSKPALPDGFAGGNGRLEAKQVFVSTKYPGRIKDVLFDEGATVQAGQVVARMDTTALEAQLQAAEAQISEAQANRTVAQAQIRVQQAGYDYANLQYQRSQSLVPRGAVSQQEAEIDNAHMLESRAQLAGAKAQEVKAGSTIEAQRSEADRLRSEIKDAVLVAPIQSRVETRLSEPGEVLPAGGRVFSLNDLSDVYMYIYLPEKITGKVPLGSEARIVLDAAPQYPIRAYVAFVSPMAQFTPKTVETAEERHNLTFRVKLQIPKERLQQYLPLVKTGLPGMGYVRFTNAPWPAKLEVKPVPRDLWNVTGASTEPR